MFVPAGPSSAETLQIIRNMREVVPHVLEIGFNSNLGNTHSIQSVGRMAGGLEAIAEGLAATMARQTGRGAELPGVSFVMTSSAIKDAGLGQQLLALVEGANVNGARFNWSGRQPMMNELETVVRQRLPNWEAAVRDAVRHGVA